jgi:hypothetical protein
MLRHIVVGREYNFESDVESHINGDDLSELSDFFDDDETTMDQRKSSMKLDTSISLDEISYSRDLNMINVPSSSKSKTLLLVRDNDRSSNRRKGAADAIYDNGQKRRQGDHKRDVKEKQVNAVDKSKKKDRSRKDEQRPRDRSPETNIQRTEDDFQDQEPKIRGDGEKNQRTEKSNVKLSKKDRKNGDHNDVHRTQRPAIAPSLAEDIFESFISQSQRAAYTPVAFGYGLETEQESEQGRRNGDEQWAHHSRSGFRAPPNQKVASAGFSHYSNWTGEYAPGTGIDDIDTSRRYHNYENERAVSGRHGRGRAGRGRGHLLQHRVTYRARSQLQEYEGYYDQSGSYYYDDNYGQNHNEYGGHNQTEYYTGEYERGAYYQPDSEHSANVGYYFQGRNNSQQQAVSETPDVATKPFVTTSMVEADLAAVAALNPNAEEFVPSFASR